MTIRWNFGEDEFRKAVEGIEKQDDSEDFLGNLYIGDLCFDLVLRDHEGDTGVVLDADLYVGGVDTGYGYTRTNQLPYDERDGFVVMNKSHFWKIGGLDNFRRHLFGAAMQFVNDSGDTQLMEKMNGASLFDWS